MRHAKRRIGDTLRRSKVNGLVPIGLPRERPPSHSLVQLVQCCIIERDRGLGTMVSRGGHGRVWKIPVTDSQKSVPYHIYYIKSLEDFRELVPGARMLRV